MDEHCRHPVHAPDDLFDGEMVEGGGENGEETGLRFGELLLGHLLDPRCGVHVRPPEEVGHGRAPLVQLLQRLDVGPNERIEDRFDGGRMRLGVGEGVVEQLEASVVEGPDDTIGHASKHRPFRSVVVMDGSHVDVGGTGDLSDGGSVKSLFREQPLGGVDLLPRKRNCCSRTGRRGWPFKRRKRV